jgi:hypothetical protein
MVGLNYFIFIIVHGNIKFLLINYGKEFQKTRLFFQYWTFDAFIIKKRNTKKKKKLKNKKSN